ncbi:prolipoprotein diacylglyceryl transferase [Christensenellaceae bacterium OttesenSCG-928-L17]|nr:prolipoprotein diacylglyceryl transferase [Christensenellaceae bacterium OttesenSCG-928-L17]
MFDEHIQLYGHNTPLIFGVIPAYAFFVGLGILAGLTYYFINLRRGGGVSEGAIKIVAAALIFGMIGSKIPLLFEGRSWEQILLGKSIIGGLIGGAFGVILIKKLFNIKQKLGNVIAPSIALGMAVGRIGCFLNGCCYGIVANWGVDFSDGHLRIPTQLFEIAFHSIAFGILVYLQPKASRPGILFKSYLLAYFIFRFAIEFIRDNPTVWLGMSIYQIICILGIIYLIIIIWKGHKANGQEQPKSPE